MGTTLDGRVIPGNRFTKTVKIHSAALAKRLADGAITQEDIDKMEASLDDTSQMDLHGYQNAQSQAFACGEITMEEAQSLFKAFGGDAASEVQWKKQPVAVKSAATAFAGELIMKACKRPGVLP